MRKILRVLPALPALALAACATAPQVTTIATDTTVAPDVTTLQAPAQTTATAASMTDASAFVDPGAYSQLSGNSKTQLASAQFNALQFGRVGAPRNWNGDKGQSGSITVGPYVRVNLIDCRDFTNTVTVGGQNFVKKGTACREADGHWSVSATKTG
jgi:surface antigen